ncbi:MAG: hypothetical protein ACXV2H_12630 [Actinomycetes bacterium]
MDAARVALLRELLQSTGWVDRTRSFAAVMRRSTRTPRGLMLVGTPSEEPWHLAAHLDEESRWSGLAEIAPTLVRWEVPADAPPHLSVGLERLETAARGETVLVVAEDVAPDPLLERVSDARRHGATVLALDGGDEQLEGLAHESLTVVQADLVVPGLSFDTVQHLVSAAAGDPLTTEEGERVRRGFRDRLARALDTISGTPSRG